MRGHKQNPWGVTQRVWSRGYMFWVNPRIRVELQLLPLSISEERGFVKETRINPVVFSSSIVIILWVVILYSILSLTVPFRLIVALSRHTNTLESTTINSTFTMHTLQCHVYFVIISLLIPHPPGPYGIRNFSLALQLFKNLCSLMIQLYVVVLQSYYFWSLVS